MRSCPATSATRAADLVLGEPELERSEGEFVEGGRAEELHVGFLEDEADLRAELAAKLRVLERVLGQLVAERRDACRPRGRRARPAS